MNTVNTTVALLVSFASFCRENGECLENHDMFVSANLSDDLCIPEKNWIALDKRVSLVLSGESKYEEIFDSLNASWEAGKISVENLVVFQKLFAGIFAVSAPTAPKRNQSEIEKSVKEMYKENRKNSYDFTVRNCEGTERSFSGVFAKMVMKYAHKCEKTALTLYAGRSKAFPAYGTPARRPRLLEQGYALSRLASAEHVLWSCDTLRFASEVGSSEIFAFYCYSDKLQISTVYDITSLTDLKSLSQDSLDNARQKRSVFYGGRARSTASKKAGKGARSFQTSLKMSDAITRKSDLMNLKLESSEDAQSAFLIAFDFIYSYVSHLQFSNETAQDELLMSLLTFKWFLFNDEESYLNGTLETLWQALKPVLSQIVTRMRDEHESVFTNDGDEVVFHHYFSLNNFCKLFLERQRSLWSENALMWADRAIRLDADGHGVLTTISEVMSYVTSNLDVTLVDHDLILPLGENAADQLVNETAFAQTCEQVTLTLYGGTLEDGEAFRGVLPFLANPKINYSKIKGWVTIKIPKKIEISLSISEMEAHRISLEAEATKARAVRKKLHKEEADRARLKRKMAKREVAV